MTTSRPDGLGLGPELGLELRLESGVVAGIAGRI
jgi:hypothetical protein